MHFPSKSPVRDEDLGEDDLHALVTETPYRGMTLSDEPVARREHPTGDRYVGSATQRNGRGVVSF